MQAFIASVIVAVVIAIGGAVILSGMNQTASQAYSTPSTRV